MNAADTAKDQLNTGIGYVGQRMTRENYGVYPKNRYFYFFLNDELDLLYY